MTTPALFLGGPLHGQWKTVDEGKTTVYYRPNSGPKMTAFIGAPKPLRPCLELEEIKGLTGRSFHRDFPAGSPRRVAEHREIQAIQTKAYLRHNFILRGNLLPVPVFVCEGFAPEDFRTDEVYKLAIRPPVG